MENTSLPQIEGSLPVTGVPPGRSYSLTNNTNQSRDMSSGQGMMPLPPATGTPRTANLRRGSAAHHVQNENLLEKLDEAKRKVKALTESTADDVVSNPDSYKSNFR